MKNDKAGKIDFAKGGSGHMFGKSGATPQHPGQTSKSQDGQGGKFLDGGHGNHMIARNGATPAVAGQTAKVEKGQGGKFAQGGSTHMFGRRGSQTRSPGSTGGM